MADRGQPARRVLWVRLDRKAPQDLREIRVRQAFQVPPALQVRQGQMGPTVHKGQWVLQGHQDPKAIKA